MKNKIKVAAYCRVSTDQQDQSNSFNSQIAYFTEFISKNSDWEFVGIYADEGLSGTSTKKRIEFNRMIADAENGKINKVLTKEVSRFARNTVDSLTFTRHLKEIGVEVFFINDNISSLAADGELRLTIMSSLAQDESRKTSERVKWGQTRRMEQGIVFGRDMLGYFVKEGKLIINPDEVEVIKLIYHKFLNEGKGTHVIARELYEAGLSPKRAKQWNNTSILRVLRNEKYVGDLLQKKTFTPDYLSHSKKYNRGNCDMVFIQDHHEPIIERVMWDNVQKELARRSPSDEQKSKHSNRYWCSGKLICGVCGARFVSRTKTLKQAESGVYKAWRCCNAAAHGTGKNDLYGNSIGCSSSSVNEKVLLYCTGFVIDYILDNKEEIINDLLRDIKSIQSTEKIIGTSKLYEKIDTINKKKAKAINLLIEGIISKDDLSLMNGEYNDEINVIAKQITDIENSNSIQQNQINDMNVFVTELNKILSFDDNSDKKLLYKEMLEKIIIHNDNVLDIYLKCMPTPIRLKYSTIGRLKNYTININKMSVIEQK